MPIILVMKKRFQIEKFTYFTLLINKIMKSYPVLLIFIFIALNFTSCKTNKTMQNDPAKPYVTGPRVIIYKTTENYYMHVPVVLSEDKKSLVSYPAPGDVYFNGDLAYPVKLEDGFFLDRRGVTPQSGFLSWTYYEYSRFEKTPSPVELLNKMLNNDPFTEMYDCGTPTQYKDMVNELNQKIKAGKFSDFRRLK